MKSHILDEQRGNWARIGVSHVWKAMGLSLSLVCASAGFALAVTGNLEPPPGEATNLNTGEPRSTTPTQPSWANRLDGLVGQAHRFKLVMGGEAVLDRETGLVWEQSPDTEEYFFNSSAAALDPRTHCGRRVTGGRAGWRLPTIGELASLVDPGNPSGNPDLPDGHPFANVQAADYWSASVKSQPNTSINLNPWYVDFEASDDLYVHFTNANAGTRPAFAWCVRGGGPLSVY